MSKQPIDTIPAVTDVGPDTPLRLETAARMAFPDGGVTARALRREAERGRLVVERVAGKIYTTLAAIEDMRRLCQVAPKRPVAARALRRAEDDPSIPRQALLLKLAQQRERKNVASERTPS